MQATLFSIMELLTRVGLWVCGLNTGYHPRSQCVHVSVRRVQCEGFQIIVSTIHLGHPGSIPSDFSADARSVMKMAFPRGHEVEPADLFADKMVVHGSGVVLFLLGPVLPLTPVT
jgi:hypothetical protein